LSNIYWAVVATQKLEEVKVATQKLEEVNMDMH
jgi:hypothetical protein